MADFDARPILVGDTVTVWDVDCPGSHSQPSAEECAVATHLVFPYRGVYVHHVGREESVAEANSAIFINEDEPYRVSHPVGGGDAALSIGVSESALLELTPKEYLHPSGKATFNRSAVRVGADTQRLSARLRHSLKRDSLRSLEGESLTVAMLHSALPGNASGTTLRGPRPQRLVSSAKLVLASDLRRRWTLAEIATEVGGVSPVYLTQVFQQLEGIPLYRYQLQLRLARALSQLGECDDLTELGLDLGFSSHSHFSAAFRQLYGQTPSAFRRSTRARQVFVDWNASLKSPKDKAPSRSP
jgi:AraC family transcriptional regulator